MMDEGVLGVDADTKRREPANLDPEELVGAFRRLAIDAHRTCNRPEATSGELVELRHWLRRLLRVARDSHMIAIERWLRSMDRMLDARLLSGLAVEVERAAG